MPNGPGMIPPHMMMMQMPGVAPGFPYGMPPPLGGMQQPVSGNDVPVDVLSHMNRKKNVLKLFTPSDSSASEPKDAAAPVAPAAAPVAAAAAAPAGDNAPTVIKKPDDPSPRASSSPRASGGSPRASALAPAPSFTNSQSQQLTCDSSSTQIDASAPVPAPRSSFAEDAKPPAATATAAATATVAAASQNTSKASSQPQHSRSSLNLLGSAVSPTAPAPQQPRPTGAAARGGQAAAAIAASSHAPAPSGAGRTVYTRELLSDLRGRAHISTQTLDRINSLKLGLNCLPSMGAQGGRLPNGMMPPPAGLSKRLPPPGKVSNGARALAPSRPVHVPSENSFVAKMQKMTDDSERKKKSIQLILNQLTSENFVKLCEKLYTHIDSVEALEIVQTKIYDKAVLDQQQNPAPGQSTFVELYAKVCHIIVQDNQPINPTTGAPGKLFFNPEQLPPEQAKGGQFRRSLLNRCQQEFERPSQGKCAEWQQLSEEDRFIHQTKEKRRMLGNVDFVGQLFLHGLLAEKTLHHCFKLLLENHYAKFDSFSKKGAPPPQDSDFDQLESFCKLLTTVGRTVDRPQAKQFMDSYFSYLQQIMGQPTIIPRMKFHIEQIIELRRCGWDLASMRQERSMPSSSAKSQKGPVAVLTRLAPGTLPAKVSPAIVQSKPAAAGGKPLSSAASAVVVPKQPPSSKSANEKMPFSGSNGSASSSSPAKPKVDLLSLPLVQFLDDPDFIDPQHQRSLDSMLDEWKCNHLHTEVAVCLRELNQPYTHAFFVFNVVTQCCDRGAHFVAKCAELLETLLQPNCLNAAKHEEALKHLTSKEFVDDYSLDCPSYKQFMTEILARGPLFIFCPLPLFLARALTPPNRHGQRLDRASIRVPSVPRSAGYR
jgi:hypothetical protein